MTHRVADQIDRIRELADEWPEYLSVAELAEQYRELEDAPTDDDEPLYAYSVFDAVNQEWVDDAV